MSILNKIFQKDKELQEKRQSDSAKAIDKASKNKVKETEKKKEVAITSDKNDSEKKAKSEKNVEKNEKSQKSSIAYKILVRPMVTEKGTGLGKYNKFLFEISSKANKLEVKSAIKELYGVMPAGINIIKMKGKKVGAMRRKTGKRRDWKKAIVSLKKGDYINTAINK
ncbi:50S ribosomal protein L23 [Patescibacteria group bacterium]